MSKQKKNELKVVKKSDILLLKVYCVDEYYNECTFAVMRITKEMKQAIITMKSVIDLVKGGGRENSDTIPASLYKMTYWSPTWGADFLHDKDIPEKFLDKVDSNNEVQYISKWIESGDELRCDINMMHVYDDGIRFECGVKHTNVKLETACIPFEQLGI